MCGYAKDRADRKRKNVTVHAFYWLLSFALSGLKMFVRFATQGVALGYSILPFQGE